MVLLWLLLPFLLFVWVSAFGLTTFWKKATENNLRALVHFQTAQVKTFLLEQQRFQQALLSSLSLSKHRQCTNTEIEGESGG